MRKITLALFLTPAVISCGGSSVTPVPTPVAVATPVPTPVPTPTPTPVPTPTPCNVGLCEEPITNTAPVMKVKLNLYTVEPPTGGFIPDPNPSNPIPVGYSVRIDATARDENNSPTNGKGPVEFYFSDEGLVRVGGQGPNQRRLRIQAAGELDCWAIQDGVRSNTLTLKFVNP